MTEQILHLLINKNCGHDCPLCCNKLYDLEKIPVVTVELLKSVQTVCLTGGDPFMMEPRKLGNFILRLRRQYPNIENLYIYTSGKMFGKNFPTLLDYLSQQGKIPVSSLSSLNGVNVAPKDIHDWLGLSEILSNNVTRYFFSSNHSCRLYVFKEQRAIYDALGLSMNDITINVIDRQWDKTFNTPENEHFARLPILL